MEVVKIVIDIWKDMELIEERKTEIKKKNQKSVKYNKEKKKQKQKKQNHTYN